MFVAYLDCSKKWVLLFICYELSLSLNVDKCLLLPIVVLRFQLCGKRLLFVVLFCQSLNKLLLSLYILNLSTSQPCLWICPTAFIGLRVLAMQQEETGRDVRRSWFFYATTDLSQSAWHTSSQEKQSNCTPLHDFIATYNYCTLQNTPAKTMQQLNTWKDTMLIVKIYHFLEIFGTPAPVFGQILEPPPPEKLQSLQCATLPIRH